MDLAVKEKIMIFIIGGSYQRKTEQALKRLGKDRERCSVYDGRKGQTGKQSAEELKQMIQYITDARAVLHLEQIVRKLMEQEELVPEWEEMLLQACEDREGQEKIITADEIGYGIVPLQAFERRYRETEGRLCQKLAARARQVFRIVCGIETQIK